MSKKRNCSRVLIFITKKPHKTAKEPYCKKNMLAEALQ